MCVAAIDIGGTKTMVGLVEKDGNIITKCTFSTILNSYHEHFSFCLSILDRLLEEHHLCKSALKGIGINVPGMVDKTHSVLEKAVFAGWTNVPVKEYFVKQSSLENVHIENDVNACAIGELKFGYKTTYQNFIWLTISTGVGGAVVCDGKLIPGFNSLAGEFGHLKVEFDYPNTCPCGQLGCLEAHGSGTAITNYTKELAEDDMDFKKAFELNDVSVDAKGCAKLAFLGNKQAINIYEKAAVYLGRGLSYGINILNPEAIILGGGVASSLELLKPTIIKVLNQNVISSLLPVDIKQTKLGYDAALLGAAALCL